MSDLDAIIREQDAARDRLRAFCIAHHGESLSIPSKHGWDLLISLCPSEPGRWRVTRFEGQEPVGHTTRDTWPEALEAAVRDYGGELMRAVTLAGAET